jgi:polyhydroxyalkanoate synthesis repressor PhaR
MDSERVIKKYSNRRLYDATASRHVTLNDLRTLIARGGRIRVVDDKSGDDITRDVLLQIVADQELTGRSLLTTAALESLIRCYGGSLQDALSRHLEQSVATFIDQHPDARPAKT